MSFKQSCGQRFGIPFMAHDAPLIDCNKLIGIATEEPVSQALECPLFRSQWISWRPASPRLRLYHDCVIAGRPLTCNGGCGTASTPLFGPIAAYHDVERIEALAGLDPRHTNYRLLSLRKYGAASQLLQAALALCTERYSSANRYSKSAFDKLRANPSSPKTSAMVCALLCCNSQIFSSTVPGEISR